MQQVVHPSNPLFVQFSDQDVMQESVKQFAQVQVDDVSCYSVVHQCCYFITEGHQISQASSAIDKVMLAVLYHLHNTYVP